MSPKPSIEKCPVLWVEGKTSFPGRDNLGAFLAMWPPKWSLRAMAPTGLSAGRVATLTMTLALKTYCEKKTQKTSYKSNPDSRRVDTLRLGRRTNAMKATQRPMPIASINSQWPKKYRLNVTYLNGDMVLTSLILIWLEKWNIGSEVFIQKLTLHTVAFINC